MSTPRSTPRFRSSFPLAIEDGRIWIETIHDIEPGEELAYDYAYILEERHTAERKRRYPCVCGAPNCRGTILADKRKYRKR